MFTEPHSTRADRGVRRHGAPTIDPATLADTVRGLALVDPEEFRAACGRVRCPVLVIHGDEDAIRPHAGGAALAEPPAAAWSRWPGQPRAPRSAIPSW